MFLTTLIILTLAAIALGSLYIYADVKHHVERLDDYATLRLQRHPNGRAEKFMNTRLL